MPQQVLTAKASRESVYQEAAFLHKPSRTLLLCDAVISASAEPRPSLPGICPEPSLSHP